MDLVREVLDKQLVDRHLRPMGRADGIIVEIREGQAPRLMYIETGPATTAGRISQRFAPWVFAFVSRNGPRRGASFRIPWSRIQHVGIEVKLDMDAEETPTFAWKQWMRERVVKRIPGA